MKRKVLCTTLVTAMLVCAAGLAGCSKAEEAAGAAASLSPMGGNTVVINNDPPMTVTVSATSTKTVEPDMAEITFGVVTEGDNAADAQEKNTKDVDAVIEKLKELGVQEKSIQTTDYYMYPKYDYNSGAETLIGYTVTTSLSVKDLTIEDAGEILTECVRAGINNISSLRYSSSQYDEVYQEALKEAAAAAAVKAEVLAEASGSQISDVPTITEGAQNTIYRYDNAAGAYAENAAMDEEKSVSLQAGELQITAQVTATYKVTSLEAIADGADVAAEAAEAAEDIAG